MTKFSLLNISTADKESRKSGEFKHLQVIELVWVKYLQLFMEICERLQGEPGAAVILQSLRCSHCFQHHVTQLLLHVAP